MSFQYVKWCYILCWKLEYAMLVEKGQQNKKAYLLLERFYNRMLLASSAVVMKAHQMELQNAVLYLFSQLFFRNILNLQRRFACFSQGQLYIIDSVFLYTQNPEIHQGLPSLCADQPFWSCSSCFSSSSAICTCGII